MAATGYYDIVEGNCSAVVRSGIIQEINRTCRVTGIDMTAFATGEKFLAVPAALVAITNVYAIGSSPTGYNNMVLTDIVGHVVPGEQSKVDVDMTYLHRGNPRAQHLYLSAYGAPLDGSLFQWRVASEVIQDETNFDVYGNLMYTGYTWPDGTTYDAEGNLIPADPDFTGNVIQVFDQPINRTLIKLTATGVLATSYPDVIVGEWTNYVNSDNWGGYPPGWARCVDVEAVQRDISQSPPLWDFTFTFLLDSKDWYGKAIFIDHRTGKIPPDIVNETGYRLFDIYPYRAFSPYFPI
jgi:hypothetical protein